MDSEEKSERKKNKKNPLVKALLWALCKYIHWISSCFFFLNKLPQIQEKEIYPVYKRKISVESVYVFFRENGYFPNSISNKGRREEDIFSWENTLERWCVLSY